MLRILDAHHDRFGLSRPFRIARGTKTVADVVTVHIRQGDAVGRGEGVPYPRYGETIDGALAVIESARSAIEGGAGRREVLELMPAGAARNAVDAALHDLEARLDGAVVAMPTTLIETAVTIVIDTPSAMARAAHAVAGVPLVKVKVDGEQVADRIRAVRAALPDARMIVDPNESWNAAILEVALPVLIEARVDLLEQPLPADDDAALARFAGRIAIAADEAGHGIADLPRLKGSYSHINIKLDKTGGLTAATALADAAEAQGFGLMLGCMVCSSLGIAPALALAPRAAFVDCDGPWWLRDDREGGVRIEGGYLHPPAPGFWGGA
ncbi:dipeptide epimerase [Sphingomonas baiyangensis]|uniref:Dipeptide epimerase n=1 Tax=Sphingomonas baiyangensis TaxID=2572576 RepID=A0A4U1L4E0_9SPHN|nr:dipeptide epimerase [Sphingomonas baiyangensis]TKD51073.1 dipeptide epimerase [Sphingomonas baiyangensis]